MPGRKAPAPWGRPPGTERVTASEAVGVKRRAQRPELEAACGCRRRSGIPATTLLVKPALSLDALHCRRRGSLLQRARSGGPGLLPRRKMAPARWLGPAGLAVRPTPRGSLPLPTPASRQGHRGAGLCAPLPCATPVIRWWRDRMPRPEPRPHPCRFSRRGGGWRGGERPVGSSGFLSQKCRPAVRRLSCPLTLAPPTWSWRRLGLFQGGPVPLGSAHHGHSALPG